MRGRTVALAALAVLLAPMAGADGVFLVDTGSPDAKMAMASRPSSTEIEAADDFVLSCPTSIERASFFGLLPADANVTQVVVEIYRVFPQDSDTSRTINVPTRANSPSDVAFLARDSGANELTFSTTQITSLFTAANSVLNDITVNAGGEGPVTGAEVRFDVTFTSTISLPAGHYFFVPQVALDSGNFFWLSAPHPVLSFSPDLQAWMRNESLAPDWLRVGTDIVGGASPPTFNGAFSLSGTTTPFSVTASAASPLSVPAEAPIVPVTFTASGGTPAYTFAEIGSIPGLSLDPSTGILSGTPTIPGTYPISVNATDSLGCTGSTAFAIVVTVHPGIPTLGGSGVAVFVMVIAAAGVLALRR
ncbi:MAG TPA: Ig domain-containing protein [Thermoanaerobaculia bacterium]|nr:Ig domain-containing protein [Thermoanaerobaculia bacterium]